MTAHVPITPLDDDLLPFVLPVELGGVNERPAGIDALTRDGRRMLLTVDPSTQTLCVVLARGREVRASYAVTAMDLMSALICAHERGF